MKTTWRSKSFLFILLYCVWQREGEKKRSESVILSSFFGCLCYQKFRCQICFSIISQLSKASLSNFSQLSRIINCSLTKFKAIIVNVCVFFMQNFCLAVLTFFLTFTPLTFCVSRDLKFSLSHNFKQLNSISGNLILKVKWKVPRNLCHFYFKS